MPMILGPGLPPLHQTRHSRELGRRVEEAVRDYRRDHPDVTESDVRTALLQSAPEGDSPEVARRKRLIGVAVAVAAGGMFTLVASTSGGRFGNGAAGWQIAGAAAAICAVAIALIRFARRN